MNNSTYQKLHLKLISHACVQIYGDGFSIICDPWLVGTSFNDGWAMYPQPNLTKIDYDEITHIWISHEHPDHLSFPSMKYLADKVNLDKVTILFQKTNSEKVFNSLKKLGFKKFKSLEHLKKYKINPDLDIFVYAHRHLDSSLGIIYKGKNEILNINDTELNDNDCKSILKKYGSFPVLLNQFSIAGFEGVYMQEILESQRVEVIKKTIRHQKLLKAEVTIPFASFMYFCCEDNKFLNSFSNTIFDFKKAFDNKNLKYSIIKLNSDKIPIDEVNRIDHSEYYEKIYRERSLEITKPNVVEYNKCVQVFQKRVSLWKKNTNRFLFNNLGVLKVFFTDHNFGVSFDFISNSAIPSDHVTEENCNLKINSQPFYFAFAFPFGIQTLGVSGRYTLINYPSNWKLLRIISSFSNQDIHFGFKSIFKRKTLLWIWSRRKGIISQIIQQIKRFL